MADDSIVPALELDDVERVEHITRAEFVERFVKPLKPVVLRGLGKQWAAWDKWSPEYFKQRFADRRVVTVSTTKKPDAMVSHYGGHTEMSMNELIDRVLVHDQDLRLGGRFTLDLALELLGDADFDFPDLGERYTRNLLWLFFGCKGSRTPLHYDFGPFHVFHTCFLGKKTFHLFDQSQGRALHRKYMTARSHANTFQPDFEKFPRLREVRGWSVDIDRGDTLYMPAGIWHEVAYHEPSIALTLRFTESTRFVAARVLYAIARGTTADIMGKVAPRLWSRIEARYS